LEGPSKFQECRGGFSVGPERADLPITDDAAAAAPPVKKLRRFILGSIELQSPSIEWKERRPDPFSPVNADYHPEFFL
jgi:hypothetical protein